MLIQYLLVASVAVVMASFLRNRNAIRFQAGKKILLILFVVACLISIARPATLSTVAQWLGVGRGADLLLYTLVVAFAFVAINTYLKFKDYEAKISILARRLAIIEARFSSAAAIHNRESLSD